MRLNKRIYDAIVVGDEIDRTHSGGIRVLIIGVTDEVEDANQPIALPSLNTMMAVPTKGTYLKVYFEDGDIHQPIYLQASPQQSYLPEDYVSDYPNKAVTNLGSDIFQMVHDRANKTTVIEHDSDSSLTYDKFGCLTHDSQKGYENTGAGAKAGNGKKIQRVLTEGTVDIFCCTPHSGGSEYLQVTHVSKATVDGTFEKEDQKATPNSLNEEGSGLDTPETRNLGGDEVEFVKAKNQIIIQNRKLKYIVVGNTGKADFGDSVNRLLNSSISAHYVIGKSMPELIQMVELDNACTFASKGQWKGETSMNKVSVSVLLTGNGTQSYSDAQYINLNRVISHIKERYGMDIEVVTIADIDPLMKNVFGTQFDPKRIA